MKEIQQYIFYRTKSVWDYWFQTKESFDDNPLETTDRVNKLLSEQEADKLTNDSRTEVRLRIIEILNNK